MLLKRGIKISSAETRLNWLRKWPNSSTFKKKENFGDVHYHPTTTTTEDFSFKFGQEMDLASVIAMNFMC